MSKWFTDIEEEFCKNVLPLEYQARGILPSEGFAFCTLCVANKVDLIIESGIYNGQSTLIWSKFFQGIRIIAIDKVLRTKTLKRFAGNHLVQFEKGNAYIELPYLLMRYPEKRIGIFIDGPKGMDALGLAATLFHFPNVFVVGTHDLHKLSNGVSNKRRVYLDKYCPMNFYTDEEYFVNKYSYMDKPPNCYGQGDEDIYWQPGKNISKETKKVNILGSYGPTVGFLVKGVL